MIHYFIGEIKNFQEKNFLINQFFGIEIIYNGIKKKGEFFLFPYFDENQKTQIYFCFDDIEQKKLFEKFYKIPGIGPKTAYQICGFNYNEIKKAVENFDIKFFKSIHGIGDKTAKRILVELKNSFSEKDISKLTVDEKIYKKIISTLKPLGYDTNKIKKILEDCPSNLLDSTNDYSIIIKWIVDNYK